MKRSTPLRRSASLSQRGSLASVTPLESRRRLSRRTDLNPQTQRQARRQRDRRRDMQAAWGTDPACQWPGCRERAEESHHVKPRARGGSDGPPNEVPVCSAHHMAAHRQPEQAWRVGMLAHSWEPEPGGAA